MVGAGIWIILLNLGNSFGCFQIFGPVQSIMKFKSMDELIERCHKTIYGLAAAVHTNDLEKALHVANTVRAGTVW